MSFGEKLSNLRKQANLTQSQLAEKLNISRQTVTKWERGVSLPDLDNLRKLASIFNTSMDELIDYKRESIKLDFNNSKESISRNNSKFSNVDNFILNKFSNAISIERLIREKKLTFWQHIFEIFAPVPAGTIELADFIGSGMVYSYLVKEEKMQYLILVNKECLLTKVLDSDFNKSIVIDGYKYCKYRNNKLK